MLISFDEMPNTARVWVYQSEKKFTDSQVVEIISKGNQFCENWAAHGNPLKSTIKIFHNQFIVIAVDENFNNTTGCSIDKSVALVQSLEQSLGISLFSRTNIAFLSKEEVFTKPLQGIKNEISSGVIDKETVTFNNLVQNIGELKEKWQIPVGESWLKRYFA